MTLNYKISENSIFILKPIKPKKKNQKTFKYKLNLMKPNKMIQQKELKNLKLLNVSNIHNSIQFMAELISNHQEILRFYKYLSRLLIESSIKYLK